MEKEGVVLIEAVHTVKEADLKKFLEDHPKKLVFGITFSETQVEVKGLDKHFGYKVRCLGFTNAEKKQILRMWLENNKDFAEAVTDNKLTRLIENEAWREEPGVFDITYALEPLRDAKSIKPLLREKGLKRTALESSKS